MLEIVGICICFVSSMVVLFMFFNQKDDKLVAVGSLGFWPFALSILFLSFKDWRYALLLLTFVSGILMIVHF